VGLMSVSWADSARLTALRGDLKSRDAEGDVDASDYFSYGGRHREELMECT
jgi:hypothetical protein